MAGYAHPEVLVEPDWLEGHLDDSGVRIVEASEDPTLYDQAHIPHAVRLHGSRSDWIPGRRSFTGSRTSPKYRN